ncbi:MAG: hypothetical protein GF350_13595 [Chitinivibrionales bacterium]|nr:hypothetical protein [Chitinivibrionales bacterium]
MHQGIDSFPFFLQVLRAIDSMPVTEIKANANFVGLEDDCQFCETKSDSQGIVIIECGLSDNCFGSFKGSNRVEFEIFSEGYHPESVSYSRSELSEYYAAIDSTPAGIDSIHNINSIEIMNIDSALQLLEADSAFLYSAFKYSLSNRKTILIVPQIYLNGL